MFLHSTYAANTFSHLAFTCSKLTIKTLEQGVKYVQIPMRRPGVFIVNLKQVNTVWATI